MSKFPKFSRTALVVALSAAFPAVSQADDVDAYINPNATEVTVKLPYYDKINPLYRQYTGINHRGVNGTLDVDVVRRSDDGAWLKFNARDVGLSTVEAGVSYTQQGDWSVGLEYNQLPRYAPYTVQTAVTGVGTARIQQPSYANTAFAGGSLISPALYDVTLKTERDTTSLTASKYLLEGLKLSFSFKNEDKTGTRMDGVRGVAGSNGTPVTGTANRYSGFLFAPEPINQKHQQFEATVDYTTTQYQISAGYYGSFLNTKYNSLTIVPGTNTATVVADLSPIALAPDNSAQQFYVSGAYNFSADTRGNLKLAYTDGKQTDTFLSGQATATGLPVNLGGKVHTTEAFASLTSRISKSLKLLGSWRYEDKQDKTPVFAYGGASPTNNPESHVLNKGKLEADYNIGWGYSLLGGLDYMNKRSDEWERHKITETTGRLALRKSLSETVNGQLIYARSDRSGSDWESAVPLYPAYLADRTRDKIRALFDWAVTGELSLQFGYEGYFDDYKQSTYGLDKGNGQVFSLDANYLINDNWKLNAWVSRQQGETKQFAQGAVCSSNNNANCTSNTPRTGGPLVQWNAKLTQDSDQFGLGVTGKIAGVDVGSQYLYSRDRNKQAYNGLPSMVCTAFNSAGVCTTQYPIAPGMGVLPNTMYDLQTLKLFGTVNVSKMTKVRLDYIYDHRKMDDYTWANWVFADGTRVNVKPNQTTQVVGLSLIQSF